VWCACGSSPAAALNAQTLFPRTPTNIFFILARYLHALRQPGSIFGLEIWSFDTTFDYRSLSQRPPSTFELALGQTLGGNKVSLPCFHLPIPPPYHTTLRPIISYIHTPQTSAISSHHKLCTLDTALLHADLETLFSGSPKSATQTSARHSQGVKLGL